MKLSTTVPLRLHVAVDEGKILEVRDPNRPSERVALRGQTDATGLIEDRNGIAWLLLDNLRPYGIPLELPPPAPLADSARRVSNLPVRDLKEAWGAEKVNVWRINPDGSEEEFFT